MSTIYNLNRYKFVLDEFQQRDVSPQGRVRFSRVTINVELNEDKLPYIEVSIRSVTGYQISRGLGGQYLGYHTILAKDMNGWEWDDAPFKEMMRLRITDIPTKILVERVLQRAKGIVKSFKEGTI
jgi:hypothetical protein